MVMLQKPRYAWFGGKVQPYEKAVIHVSSEAVYRGLNVFEGLKAYWQPDASLGLLALPRHYERLARSAKLLHMPLAVSARQFDDAAHSLIEALCVPEKDIWVRATLYMVEGHWGEDQRTDLVMTAFHMPKEPQQPVRTGVTTWRRASDSMLPARIKTSTNYQVARLAKIEGRSRGYPDMILLNQHDRVAESVLSCLLMVRDGVVATPPASEGALESITVAIVEAMARDSGIPFERRPIERSELYVADEIAFAGTITELTPVLSVDEYPVSGRTRLLARLAQRYRDAVTGVEPHPAADLSLRRPTAARRDAVAMEGARI